MYGRKPLWRFIGSLIVTHVVDHTLLFIDGDRIVKKAETNQGL